MMWWLLGALVLFLALCLAAEPIVRRAVGKSPFPWWVDDNEVWLYEQPRWLTLLLLSPAATTFAPDLITFNADYFARQHVEILNDVVRHELVHVEQAKRWGRLYVLVYMLLFIPALGVRSRHPWERQAREHVHG